MSGHGPYGPPFPYGQPPYGPQQSPYGGPGWGQSRENAPGAVPALILVILGTCLLALG